MNPRCQIITHEGGRDKPVSQENLLKKYQLLNSQAESKTNVPPQTRAKFTWEGQQNPKNLDYQKILKQTVGRKGITATRRQKQRTTSYGKVPYLLGGNIPLRSDKACTTRCTW